MNATSKATKWESDVNSISLLVYIEVDKDRPDYSSRIKEIEGLNVVPKNKDDLWSRFVFSSGKEIIYGAIFIKRMVLSINSMTKEKQSLEATLKWALEKKEFLVREAHRIVQYLAGNNAVIKFHPIVECGEIKKYKYWDRRKLSSEEWPAWVDDGLTTFHIQAFDSNINRVGIIRVSRHVTICYGLSSQLVSDIINLIYEEMLYKQGSVDKEAVFSLLSSLTKYVLPTEVDLFLHQMSSRLAVFLVVIGTIFSLASKIYDQLINSSGFIKNIFLAILVYLVCVILLWLVWRLLALLKIKLPF